MNQGSSAVRNLNRALIVQQMAIASVGEKGAKYETNLCQPCMSRFTYPRLGYSRPRWDTHTPPGPLITPTVAPAPRTAQLVPTTYSYCLSGFTKRVNT